MKIKIDVRVVRIERETLCEKEKKNRQKSWKFITEKEDVQKMQMIGNKIQQQQNYYNSSEGCCCWSTFVEQFD